MFHTIVVAYDDPASDTLERAADLAESLGATLVVTNVAPPVESEEADDAARYAGDGSIRRSSTSVGGGFRRISSRRPVPRPRRSSPSRRSVGPT